MIQNFALIAFTNIRHRKLRSFLTIISIVIGIGAVVSLVSVSQGMQDAVRAQFENMGTDRIIIMPGGGGGMMGFSGFSAGKLTENDINVIERVRGVEDASGMIFKMGKITYGDETKYAFVIGMDTSSEADWVFENFDVDGRRPKSGDKYKAAVGYLYAYGDIFERPVRQGSRIDVEGQQFEVVGIVEKIGNREDDTQVYIPIETAREVFDEPEEFGMIYAKVQTGYDPSEVAEKVKEELRDDRNLEEGEEDFTIQTAEQLMATIGTIIGLLQFILVGIAGISLLVGGVGIMNTMYTAVLERTREIGILKAIGARNSSVMSIFLFESGIIGLIGGVFGTLLGIGLAMSVELAAGQMGFGLLKLSISPGILIMGLGFAFTIGCISGVMPARRAARLQPAEALRYE